MKHIFTNLKLLLHLIVVARASELLLITYKMNSKLCQGVKFFIVFLIAINEFQFQPSKASAQLVNLGGVLDSVGLGGGNGNGNGNGNGRGRGQGQGRGGGHIPPGHGGIPPGQRKKMGGGNQQNGNDDDGNDGSILNLDLLNININVGSNKNKNKNKGNKNKHYETFPTSDNKIEELGLNWQGNRNQFNGSGVSVPTFFGGESRFQFFGHQTVRENLILTFNLKGIISLMHSVLI